MKITRTQNIQTKFFLGRTLYLGGGISLIFLNSGSDAWIAMILGLLLGIGVLYIYTKVSDSIQGSLHDYLQKKCLINYLIRFVLLSFYIFGVFTQIIIFSTFIYSYFLPYTNIILSSLPFLFLAIYLGHKGIPAVARIAQILFFIGWVIIITKFLALVPYMKIDNFLPIFTIKKTNLFITSGLFAVLSTAPFILMLEEKTSFKDNVKAYFISWFTIFIIMLNIIGSFGPNLVKTFAYPEYIILRQISVFNFIENVENFVAISWFFDIFISCSLVAKRIKDICNYKRNIYTYIIILAVLIVVNQFVMNDYVTTIYIYKSFVIIFLILCTLIYLLFGIKKRVHSKSNGKYK